VNPLTSNKDLMMIEEDLSFLDEVVTKVKDSLCRERHSSMGPNVEEVNQLKAQLGAEQVTITKLR